MATKTKPGTVVAALVLLILIAVYHLAVGVFTLIGNLTGTTQEGLEMLGEEAPEWALYLGAFYPMVIGAIAVVLAVMVGKSNPRAFPAVIGFGIVGAAGFLALIATPAVGFGAVVSAVFLAVSAGLMFSSGAKQHFSATSVGT